LCECWNFSTSEAYYINCEGYADCVKLISGAVYSVAHIIVGVLGQVQVCENHIFVVIYIHLLAGLRET